MIYIEGGGDGKDGQVSCRAGFRSLLENSGFVGKMPRLFASGKRKSAYDDFRHEHEANQSDYVALLVDSEDPVIDIEKPWDHLKNRKDDKWEKPQNATDDQVFLMATCMETWIASDRDTLKKHYKKGFKENALPSLNDIEKKNHHDVQKSLAKATKDCWNAYRKGERSFEILGKLNPAALETQLSAFRRMKRILLEKLAVET
ncbi:MAG: DUF4276 family protein [Planctomycetes bacterium]|nr:DUF4276 family protein [Planctomycetota bacterium]